MLRAGPWVAACALGPAVGTAAVAILIPGLGYGIHDFFNGRPSSGDVVIVFFFPAGVLLGAGVLTASRRHLAGIDVEETELDEITDHAESITIGSES